MVSTYLQVLLSLTLFQVEIVAGRLSFAAMAKSEPPREEEGQR